MRTSLRYVLATLGAASLVGSGASLAVEPSCQQLDQAVVERVVIAAKADPNDRTARIALNRAHHRITAARIDCKHGRIDRARARYAQALDELSGPPPTLADADMP